jgi:hypothetical protein
MFTADLCIAEARAPPNDLVMTLWSAARWPLADGAQPAATL